MGRPRTFDDTEALDAALACFWGRGYEATSVRDLGEAMGISAPSLYNAFGDKQSLYRECLLHYGRTRTLPMLQHIERENPGIAALPAFFAEIVSRSVSDRERRGCFLVNSALEVAPHDSAMAEVVAAHVNVIRGFLQRAVEAGLASGEIARPVDAAGAADLLMSVLLGIRVLARTQPDRALLERTVCAALVAIGVPEATLGALRSEKVTGRGRGRMQ